ncbi:MAG: dihydrolipoyl dehydrogenase [Muribaculaceae bacterium]|nr:dihydrolipoyl dehydrogenase [Muribaculaceae bacterium]
MNYDLIVIGAGPAGYPAAACGVRQGLKTLLIEAGELGGACLNRGCIPTKTFCRSAETALEIDRASEFGINLPEGKPTVDMARIVERKNGIVMQLREAVSAVVNGADVKLGKARFISSDEVEVAGEVFTAPRIIVATGATPVILPIPGAELCVTSDQLLDTTTLPASMAVIGGGVIGMEFASVYASFGCEVTVIEYCKEILPGFDRDIAKRLRSSLSKRGVKFILNAAATAVEKTADGRLKVKYEAKNKPGETEVEKVLMAVGRKAVIPEGLEAAGAEITRKGITVDKDFQTTIPGVYAIGDCNGICQLAHAATAQARRVMGVDTDLSPIPAAVFTVPEAASAGLTEEQAEAEGITPLKTVKLPFRANGKALTQGEAEGLVKMLVSDDRIVGCHILGPHASDLIMEVSLAISAGLPASAVTRAIHPHPTLCELIPSALSQTL